MKTVLRKLIIAGSEYYAVIDHDLEYFKLRILKPWEMSANEDSYRVNRGVVVPSYVTTMVVDNDDIMFTDYTIKDCDNIFINLYNAMLKFNPIDILTKYVDYKWIFNKEAIYLENKYDGSKLSILEPFEYWKGNQPYDKRLFYHINDNVDGSLLYNLIGKGDKPLLNVDLHMYSYPVFRTIWYDTLVYTEYIILKLRALNTFYKVFSKNTVTDAIILDEPVVRTVKDVAIECKVSSIDNSLLKSNTLSDMYKILDRYNNKLSVCYMSVLKELSFLTETEIDWDVFKAVYKKHIDKYTLAIIMYMRWNFIRSMISIPESFNNPLTISTPLGNLIVKGGEPLWEVK